MKSHRALLSLLQPYSNNSTTSKQFLENMLKYFTSLSSVNIEKAQYIFIALVTLANI